MWALENVPWQEQVEALLESRRVEEALQIGRSYAEEESGAHFLDILQRAALIQLHRKEYVHARELLIESECRAEVVLAFWPDLFPGADIRTAAPFPVDIFNLATPSVLQERNRFLLDYLHHYRSVSPDFTEVRDCSVLTLC